MTGFRGIDVDKSDDILMPGMYPTLHVTYIIYNFHKAIFDSDIRRTLNFRSISCDSNYYRQDVQIK